MLSIKDLVFKERLARKLVDWYVSLYVINKIVFIYHKMNYLFIYDIWTLGILLEI